MEEMNKWKLRKFGEKWRLMGRRTWGKVGLYVEGSFLVWEQVGIWLWKIGSGFGQKLEGWEEI